MNWGGDTVELLGPRGFEVKLLPPLRSVSGDEGGFQPVGLSVRSPVWDPEAAARFTQTVIRLTGMWRRG
ncbi:hypothetical protein GN956_G3458 [Arapaima gigas]